MHQKHLYLTIILIALSLTHLDAHKKSSFKKWAAQNKLESQEEYQARVARQRTERDARAQKRNPDCSICFEPAYNLKPAIITSCNHIFCHTCLNRWLNKQKTCPVCRKKLLDEIPSSNIAEELQEDQPLTEEEVNRIAAALVRNARHSAFEIAFHDAQNNSFDELAQLIENQEVNPHHGTAIHIAAGFGQYTIVKTLLQQQSASVHNLDDRGWTPLHYAVAENHVNLIHLLVVQGRAHISARSIEEETPLHVAARHGCPDAVFILLLYGARRDVRTQDIFGRTPRQSALYHNADNFTEQVTPFHFEAARLLREEERALGPLHTR